MADLAAIAGGFSALKHATELVKSLIDIRDRQLLRDRSSEILDKLYEARMRMIDTQTAYTSMQTAYAEAVERIRGLEEQLRQCVETNHHLEQYEMQDIGHGTLAYVPKPASDAAAYPHALCANCYGQRRKSVLQATGEVVLRQAIAVCPACRTRFPFIGWGAVRG